MQFDNYKIKLLESSENKAFFNLIENNRVRLEDFFAGTVSRTQTFEDTVAYCREIEERITNKTYLPFIIIDTTTNDFVGLVDVKNIDWSIPKAELGLFIDKHYEGKGITTKAMRLVIKSIISKYHFKKLLCRASSKNLGSISVILKNNFKLEGTIRRDYKTTKGEIVDLNYYGRIFD
ncbi:GNAT family N-acetyltransferase [Pontimicrobium sp. MEBiC06410]